MTEESSGLKVAYRGAPSEDEIRAILKKKKSIQLAATIFILSIATVVAWYAFTHKDKLINQAKPETSENQ